MCSFLYRGRPSLFLRSPTQLIKAAADAARDGDDDDVPVEITHYHPARAYLPFDVIHRTEKRSLLTMLETAVFPTASLAECQHNFQLAQAAFRGSRYCNGLDAVLGTISGVKRIVAFGLGSLSWAQNEKPAHHAHHALLLALREMCKVKEGKVYVQDPVYAEQDKKLLKDECVTVLDDPRALAKVSDESLVFAVSPNIPVRELVTELARPKVLLWNCVYGHTGADQ